MRDVMGMDPDGRGEEGKLGGVKGGVTNQDIFFEKRVYFQLKKKIKINRKPPVPSRHLIFLLPSHNLLRIEIS